MTNIFSDISQFIHEEISNKNSLTSIYQGNLWKKYKFNKNTVFPLLLFFDDLELCNALGSRAGLYKVGTIYISLACVPLQYASLLENIFLAQLFFSDRKTFGNEKIFQNLIADLAYLEDEGIEIYVENQKHHIFLHFF